MEKNHSRETAIWLVCYKKHTGKPSVPYNDAVEEALCFGWVDSIIKSIDEEKYQQKYTPRKKNSIWSKSNKERIKKLIKQKKMMPPGMELVDYAKKNGSWDKIPESQKDHEFPPIFQKALNENPKAKEFFDGLAPGYRKEYVSWIASAKRAETRERRVIESIDLLTHGKKLGMK